jgi:hypothetical protein
MALSDAEKQELESLRRDIGGGDAGFGEKAGALAYGAATGFAGGLGELEKFAAYDVPEMLGFREKGKRDKVAGRETIFPTVEEAQKGLAKVGIKKPKEDVGGYQTAGEVIGGFGTSLPGMLKGGAKMLLGTPSKTSEALPRLRKRLVLSSLPHKSGKTFLCHPRAHLLMQLKIKRLLTGLPLHLQAKRLKKLTQTLFVVD